MGVPKRKNEIAWLVGFTGILIVGTASLLFAFCPPLPAYIKVPPGSSVQVSRRFHAFMWGPEYYCRVHSPLSAWQTADYMKQSSNAPLQYPQAFRSDEPSVFSMNGWALQRTGYFVDVRYRPDEIGAGHSQMRVWPDPAGSTIEFYYESRFD